MFKEGVSFSFTEWGCSSFASQGESNFPTMTDQRPNKSGLRGGGWDASDLSHDFKLSQSAVGPPLRLELCWLPPNLLQPTYNSTLSFTTFHSSKTRIWLETRGGTRLLPTTRLSPHSSFTIESWCRARSGLQVWECGYRPRSRLNWSSELPSIHWNLRTPGHPLIYQYGHLCPSHPTERDYGRTDIDLHLLGIDSFLRALWVRTRPSGSALPLGTALHSLSLAFFP